MKALELYPAVDIKDGKAARLIKGQLNTTENFGDPTEVVNQFIDAGSKWIHLVDLDAAFGTGNNRIQIKEITSIPDISFQLSGGINNQQSLDFALSTAAKQINLATSALLDLQWVEQVLKSHGDKLSVSLDVAADTNQLIARGSGQNLGDLNLMIENLNAIGCTRFIITDIDTDGALSGPNLDLLKKVSDKTEASIISSGGVGSIDDLIQLRQMQIDGVVLGKALYSGQIDLISALSACYK
jgi:phosphoribosylformimino-5-aminoimidazole carboxamide ribotide isomerase